MNNPVTRKVDRKPSREELAKRIYDEENKLYGGTLDIWPPHAIELYITTAMKVLDKLYHPLPQYDARDITFHGYYVDTSEEKVIEAIGTMSARFIQAIINALRGE